MADDIIASLDRDYLARQALALGVTDVLGRLRAASGLT